MKKQLTLLLVLFLSISIHAQKPDITEKKITINIDRPAYLKTIKTYSYEIQDDGKYWNFTNTDAYPADTYSDLASLTDGINIEGLTKVTENADLKIVVGFIGSQLKNNNNSIEMSGTMHLMLILKDQLFESTITNTKMAILNNPKKYPRSNRAERNQTKAKMLTNRVQGVIDSNLHLFSDKLTLELPFGLFRKVKKGKAVSYNEEAKPLIDAILADPENKQTLDKAINFWKSQLEVDFGKKLKEKYKNRVLHANLSTASFLKNDIENAQKHYEIAKKNSGFFDSWTSDLKRAIAVPEILEKLETKKLEPIEIHDKMTYFIVIEEEGVLTYKKKNIPFTKIEIAKFIPVVSSGITSLDTKKAPKILVYLDDKLTYNYVANEKMSIKTNSKTIVFELVKNEYKPVFK